MLLIFSYKNLKINFFEPFFILLNSSSIYRLHGKAKKPNGTVIVLCQLVQLCFSLLFHSVQDPQDKLKEECAERAECQKLRAVLEECNDRVNSKSKTSETCDQELYDFVHCVDHCVSDMKRNLWNRYKFIVQYKLLIVKIPAQKKFFFFCQNSRA